MNDKVSFLENLWSQFKYHIFWRVLCPFGFHVPLEISIAQGDEGGIFRLDGCIRCGRTDWEQIADYLVRGSDGSVEYFWGVGDEFDE